MLTVSNYTSDTSVESQTTKAELKDLTWAKQKTDSRSDKQSTELK